LGWRESNKRLRRGPRTIGNVVGNARSKNTLCNRQEIIGVILKGMGEKRTSVSRRCNGSIPSGRLDANGGGMREMW